MSCGMRLKMFLQSLFKALVVFVILVVFDICNVCDAFLWDRRRSAMNKTVRQEIVPTWTTTLSEQRTTGDRMKQKR